MKKKIALIMSLMLLLGNLNFDFLSKKVEPKVYVSDLSTTGNEEGGVVVHTDTDAIEETISESGITDQAEEETGDSEVLTTEQIIIDDSTESVAGEDDTADASSDDELDLPQIADDGTDLLNADPELVNAAPNELTDVSASTMQSAQSEFMKYLTGYYGFNVQGVYNGDMIQTTFSNDGYQSAFQVGNGSKNRLNDFQYGKLYESDGVQVRIFASLADGGRAVAITYEVHNKNSSPVTVKIGSSADTQVGENDGAAISFDGNQIVMEDTNTSYSTYGAQFRVYPGEGNFTTKWFGYYGSAYDNMFNNSSEAYSGDSGLAWSWTISDIAAGTTVTKVAKLKVMKSLEILDSNLTADLENENVVMTVPYEDKADLTQTLHYTIDGSEDLGGETLETTGTVLTNTFTKDIDVSANGLNWAPNSNHTVRIWLTNNNNVNSATLTYNVYWAGDTGDTSNLKTLSFSSNSGNMFADVKAGSGTVYKLPSDTMNGFVFKGWSKNADGSGTLYQAGTDYTINADETLYAVFKRKLTVTFNTMGGTPDSFNRELAEGDKVARPDDPEKDGYVFGGWFTNQECTSEYDFSSTVTGNKTLYAKWTLAPATAPTINSVKGATLTYGYSSGSVSISASAATDAEYTLTYQWYKSSADSNTDGTIIDGATEATYNVPEDKPIGTKEYYYCVVTATRNDNNQKASSTSDVAVVKVISEDTGVVEVVEPETPNSNDAKLADEPAEIISKIELTDEDIEAKKFGKDIFVFFEVEDISESVPDADKELVEELLSTALSDLELENVSDMQVGMYLDISLFKQIEGEDKVKVTETSGAIKISFEIPEALRKDNRTFYIVRVHEGVATIITPTQDGNTLTFETDQFSTYALVYTDAVETKVEEPEKKAEVTEKKSPTTGDKINFAVIIMVMIDSAIAALYLTLRRRMTK